MRIHQRCKLAFCLAQAAALCLAAGENATGTASPERTAAIADPATTSDLLRLRAQIAAQQQQIDNLRQTIVEQQKLIDRALRTAPHNIELATAAPAVTTTAANGVTQKTPDNVARPAPLSFDIGVAKFTPFGFVDFTSTFRSTNVGSGIGTSFGSIPFSNTVQGKLTENRLTLQNSRVGLRIDSKVLGADVIGYLETDFLGNAPANLAVTSNSDTLRMRLYWADIRKNKFEMLAGQSWSMMTPNREGLSPLPSGIFYSQDVDTNYQAGLVWGRDPQLRLIYHPNSHVAWGLSIEAAEQYVGGAVTFPAALSNFYATQFNNGNTGTSVPNLHPDFVSKIAFDGKPGGRAVHFELAGLLRSFRAYDPLNNHHYTTVAGGGSANANVEVMRGLRLIANTFLSDGGGRYIFGLGPDLVVRPDGSISPVHAASTVDGFEYSYKPKDNPNDLETLFYAYYGGAYYRRNFSIDTSASRPVFVGYGFPGSTISANRSIQEGTFGVTQTFWKNPVFGDLRLMTQYSYLTRNPWSPAASPRNAHTHMLYLNLRYDIP